MRVGLIAAQNVAHAARFELEDAAGEALRRRSRRSSRRRAADLRRSSSTPRCFSISFSASSMMVSVVSPRKSILSRPSFSRPFMSYWVTISSRFVLYSGTSSFSGSGEITTPAACTEQLRARPSRLQRDIQHLVDARILLRSLVEAGLLLESPPSSLMLSSFGTSLVMRSTSAKRHVEHAADVFDRRARAQRAERDDLRHLLAAVLLGHVLDHFAAAVHAEVDVDIGHADALGIQEALEQQAVLQRIDIGDLHRVADQAAGGRTAARTHRNAVLLARSG